MVERMFERLEAWNARTYRRQADGTWHH
jgi:hypothetical protein